MDESAIKGQKSLQLNYSGAASWKPPRSAAISVEGYDTRLQEYTLKLALTKHFSSCGDVRHIYVPRDFERGILKSVTFMWINGEDAEEKALRLSGTDVGGWTAIVKATPFQKEFTDPWCPATVNRPIPKDHLIAVTGYDTSLPEIDIQMALCQHFSSCGEVRDVMILYGCACAQISLIGERCEEKALKLSGSNLGGMNLLVESPLPKKPKKRSTITGYTPPSTLLEVAEKKKEKIKMEMETEMDEKKKKKMKVELMKTEKEIIRHMGKKKKIDMAR